MLTRADLLWFGTSDDVEGRVTAALLARPPDGTGVLVEDNGESQGLRLSRDDAQDLPRALVTWPASRTRSTPR